MLTIKRISLCLLIVLGLLLSGCEKENEDIIREEQPVIIQLIESDTYGIFEKTMIMYEDQHYLIQSPLSYFIGELSDFYFHDYDSYLTTIENIISDGETRDTLLVGDYFESQRLVYIIAHILEKGKCHIYNKVDRSTVFQITIEKWEFSPAPLAGAGGRRFYINGELFLETTDWIS